MRRLRIAAFAAVGLSALVLAVLGYVSLRQWEAAAELLLREQARDMATMAAERVEMAVLKAEEEDLTGLQMALLEPSAGLDRVDAWLTRAKLAERVFLFDRQGRLVRPAADAALAAALLAEIPHGLWDRGGRRHVAVDDRVVLAAVLRTAGGDPVLAVLTRNEDALRRDMLERGLRGAEGGSVLAVVDRADRPVYAARPLDRAQRLLTVGFGEALPSWRVALYQPEGLSPREVVRRQTMMFVAAFALVLVVILLGLGAAYGLVRRESEMARLKSDFVANVSHDLKTPLSLIRMFAETLEMNRVSDEPTRREYYGVITRESERLTRLIDNVLDFSRIESGGRRYDLHPTAVEPLIQETVDAFRYPLAQQGFKVDVEVEPGLPEVPMDAAAMGQALANLLDNAIKYSGDGRRLAVAARRDPARGEIAIEVGDDGIGIPAAEVRRIFDKFYRVGRSETQGRRGSGLGLALVKHVVEAHGGRVGVESRPGAGSRFTIHLPIA